VSSRILLSVVALGRSIVAPSLAGNCQKYQGDLFELTIRLGGKADRDNGAEGKPQQHNSISGIAHRETSVRLEQERGEDQAAHDREKQARQAPAGKG
jgi:hypothetical protein